MNHLGASKVPPDPNCDTLGLTKLSQHALIAKGPQIIEQAESDLQNLGKLMVEAASKH